LIQHLIRERIIFNSSLDLLDVPHNFTFAFSYEKLHYGKDPQALQCEEAQLDQNSSLKDLLTDRQKFRVIEEVAGILVTGQ
jgi:hypothetical protein